MISIEVHTYLESSFITIMQRFYYTYDQSVKTGLKLYKKLINKILDFPSHNWFYWSKVILIYTTAFGPEFVGMYLPVMFSTELQRLLAIRFTLV